MVAFVALSAHALAAAALFAVSMKPTAGSEVCFNDDSGLRLLQLTARKFQADKRNSSSKVVFVKTHYTGSSTFAGILQRYCDQHNATCALRSLHGFNTSTLSREDLKDYVKSFPKKDGVDIWPWHVEYDRQAFEQLIPGALAVSLFREPIPRVISGWSHTRQAQTGKAHERLHGWKANHTSKFAKCGPTMHNQVPKLSDLDLVMLTEDYNRSLVLVARRLGWPLQNVLYTRKKVSELEHSTQRTMDEVKDYLSQPLENMTEAGKSFMKHCIQPEIELYNGAKKIFESQLAAMSREQYVEVQRDVARFQSGLQVLEDCCTKEISDQYCNYLQEGPVMFHERLEHGTPPHPGVEHAHCRLMALSALRN